MHCWEQQQGSSKWSLFSSFITYGQGRFWLSKFMRMRVAQASRNSWLYFRSHVEHILYVHVIWRFRCILLVNMNQRSQATYTYFTTPKKEAACSFETPVTNFPHPILEYPQFVIIRQRERPSFASVQNKRQNYSSVYLSLYVCG